MSLEASNQERKQASPRRDALVASALLAAALLTPGIVYALHFAFPFRHHVTDRLTFAAWTIEHELSTGWTGLALYALSLIALLLATRRACAAFRRSVTVRSRLVLGALATTSAVTFLGFATQLLDASAMLRGLM